MQKHPPFAGIIMLLLFGCYVVQTLSPIPSTAMSAFPGLGGLPVTQVPADGLPSASGEGTITLEHGISLPTPHRQLILDYMDAYYRSLAALETEYPHHLFAPDSTTQVIGDKAVWEIMVEVRKMQTVDLHLDDFRYEMTCNRVTEQENGDITVRLTENNIQNFRQYPGVDSESKDIRHTFTLTRVSGFWCIKQHRGGGTVSHLVMRDRERSTDIDMLDVMDSVPETKGLIIEDATVNVAQRTAQIGTGASTPPPFERTYDRDAAVSYATQWALERNPRWPVYDDYGGNCANFVSQCLSAGGIPMDHKGESQWKWYGETPDLSQRASGRSPAWASVDAFYEYAVENTGYGLVSQVDANYYDGQPGDILQLGFLEDWRHAVTITSVVKDDSGKTIDYLISSNTADQRDFPASAYFYTMQRLIRVYGWND